MRSAHSLPRDKPTRTRCERMPNLRVVKDGKAEGVLFAEIVELNIELAASL
jgi:hypothetical protein